MLRSSILYKDKLQYKSGFSETQALASEQLCILADTYKHLVLVTPRRVLPRHTLTGSQSFLHTLEQFTPTSRSDCRKVEHLRGDADTLTPRTSQSNAGLITRPPARSIGPTLSLFSARTSTSDCKRPLSLSVVISKSCCRKQKRFFSLLSSA